MPVASPCRQICVMDPHSGLCVGCARTLDEIASWSALDDAAKRRILLRIEQRRASSSASTAAAPRPPRDPGG